MRWNRAECQGQGPADASCSFESLQGYRMTRLNYLNVLNNLEEAYSFNIPSFHLCWISGLTNAESVVAYIDSRWDLWSPHVCVLLLSLLVAFHAFHNFLKQFYTTCFVITIFLTISMHNVSVSIGRSIIWQGLKRCYLIV